MCETCSIESFVDSFEVPDNFEDVQSIQFNALDEFVQIFVITTTNGVIFAKWVCYL